MGMRPHLPLFLRFLDILLLLSKRKGRFLGGGHFKRTLILHTYSSRIKTNAPSGLMDTWCCSLMVFVLDCLDGAQHVPWLALMLADDTK